MGRLNPTNVKPLPMFSEAISTQEIDYLDYMDLTVTSNVINLSLLAILISSDYVIVLVLCNIITILELNQYNIISNF